MANQNKGQDDGVVTSAQSGKVGSLLADLLNDVKQSVAEEAKEIETETERRAREEREVREREESQKRAAAQQKLIEETRRRNEALARRERAEGERKAMATAPHMRPLTGMPEAGPKSAEISVAAVQVKPTNKLVLAALVVIGIGVGLGTGFALTPTPRDAGIDVAAAAKAVVAATRKQATAEHKVLMDLEVARKQIADLQREVGEAKGAHKSLQDQLAVLKKDFETTRQELEGLKGGAGGDKGPRRTGNGGGGVPNINSSIFNK